jgi:hypothetical protein
VQIAGGLAAEALDPPKCYRTRYRAGPRTYSATVVATVNDPMAIRGPPCDNTDMVRPDNHHPNCRTPGIPAFPSPLSSQSKPAVRLPEVTAHVNPAPGVCSMHVMISVMGTSIGVAGKRAHKSCRNGDCFEHCNSNYI